MKNTTVKHVEGNIPIGIVLFSWRNLGELLKPESG